MTPDERWAPFRVDDVVASLPPAVGKVFAKFGWHRWTSSPASSQVVDELSELMKEAGRPLSTARIRSLLVAGAYLIDPSEPEGLSDSRGMAALEDAVNFVNGYLQSLPPRRLPNAPEDPWNRAFRSYQRRRHGYDATTRSPQMFFKKLPDVAQNVVEQYTNHLLYESEEIATNYAATIAVALGRPIDPTIVNQLEIALATLSVWRDMAHFPKAAESHPLLGEPSDTDPELWQTAAAVVARCMYALEHLDESDGWSNPALVHAPSRVPVASVDLDAQSLFELQRLVDYVNTFASWLKVADNNGLPASERLTLFDRSFSSNPLANTTGADLIAELPPRAMRLIANFDALKAREKSGRETAVELATALGDKDLAPNCHRMLDTAVAWLNGDFSKLETGGEESTELSEEDLELLVPFQSASQREAEALLDLGAAITELVRFSRTLGSGSTPEGWWIKFHKRSLGGIPTPRELLERLPDGSRRLLQQQLKLLQSEHFGDLTTAPSALAGRLGREEETVCVRTLAVALSVGTVWAAIERLSKGVRGDTLLGAEPEGARERFVCARAQAQVEWGLQELLRTNSAVGV